MGKNRRMRDLLDELLSEPTTSGDLIRAMRKREGMTLENMEEVTGIRTSNLSAIENNKIEVTKHYADIFAAALNVLPSMFLYPNGERPNTPELKKIAKRAQKYRRKWPESGE